MPVYKAPIEDVTFLLNDVFGIEKHNNLPGFADLSPDMIEAILGEAAKVCEEQLQPLNLSGDREGCTRAEDGSVTVPKGFKEAYHAYVEGGWLSLAGNPEYGGQGLPYTIAAVVNEFTSSANMAFAMYPGLTAGAIAAIDVHGSDEQKQAYLPNMIAGTWTGTMNLTEPHCGTDLGMLRTKAVPNADGSYAITGTKIFISAGEQNITENIIHLVLARIEGAPEGVKGISLFIVPKFVLTDDGKPGERNAVVCGSIEHKMGIHGNSTCVMNFDGAKGYLIGEANKGLNAMFVMMNEARLGVAIQGLAQSEAAYQNAAAYAKDRIQGRALTGAKFPDKKADPIIVHPDVRKNLMTIRAFNEGARAYVIWSAIKSDLAHRSPDAAERETNEELLGLMTPVLKGYLTDKGFDNAVIAQQVFGGHGYIEEWGMSQFVRDARIAMIYEGANGIQALDLVGRKLPRKGGAALMAFMGEIGQFVQANSGDDMKPFTAPLGQSVQHLQASSMWLMQNGMANPDNAGAASTDYMHLMGLVALGYMWALQAKVALAKGESEAMKSKLVLARFFAERMLPETAYRLARIQAGAKNLMELPAEAF